MKRFGFHPDQLYFNIYNSRKVRYLHHPELGKFEAPNSQFNHMDKIIDGLYLGNIQGASNLAMLKKKGITHILHVAADFKPFFPGEFNYLVINILDMPFENIMRHFKPAAEFIK
jgi:hypothetical protein